MAHKTQQKLTDLNNRLISAIKNARQKNKLEAQVTEIESELSQAHLDLESLRIELEREAFDVKILEEKTLHSVFFELIGRRKKKLTKERMEQEKAQLAYTEMQHYYRYLIDKQTELIGDLNSVAQADLKLDAIMHEKKALLAEINHPATQEIEQITDEIESLRFSLIEILLSIVAGKLVDASLEIVLEKLASAKSWGEFDLIGGGILSSLQKRERIREAIVAAELLMEQTADFNRELKDIHRLDESIPISMNKSLMGFDVIFDNVFTDWTVLSEINSALATYQETNIKLGKILAELNQLQESTEIQISSLGEKKKSLIEEAA